MPTTPLPVANPEKMKQQLQTNEPIHHTKEYKQAWQFSKQPKLLDVVEAALHDKSLRDIAVNDANQFLLKAGIDLPKGLDIEFSLTPGKFMPMPESYWFEIRMSNCRKFIYWDKKKKQVREESVCLEIKVIGRIPLPSPII